MATEVKLPRLGQGMESGTIVKWLKSEGEPVEKGEGLYELDTDKVTQEVEAEATGVLLKIAVQEGEVEVGRTIGFIGAPGERVESAAGDGDAPRADSTRQALRSEGGAVEERSRSVNGLVARQRELNPDVRITVTDLLTRVCAQALMRHREVNVQYTEDALLVFPSAGVGIAVAAPQGLVVPVVRAAERLTIAQIAAVRADLVSRARDAKLRTDDLEGGTFTISNLGMYDIDRFIAVLNPPQASILAVG